MPKVKNVNGTSRFSVPSGYNSWLDYWEKQTGKTVSICGVRGCSDSDLVGGHVMKVNSTDKHYYNSSLKFEIMAKQLYVASQRVL